jgi:hypothetical protein
MIPPNFLNASRAMNSARKIIPPVPACQSRIVANVRIEMNRA